MDRRSREQVARMKERILELKRRDPELTVRQLNIRLGVSYQFILETIKEETRRGQS